MLHCNDPCRTELLPTSHKSEQPRYAASLSCLRSFRLRWFGSR